MPRPDFYGLNKRRDRLFVCKELGTDGIAVNLRNKDETVYR
jgi:hypothetical protein